MFKLLKYTLGVIGFVYAAPQDLHVRVLLAEGDSTQAAEWQFTTAKKSFLCIWSEKTLSCNGKKLSKNAIRITAEDGHCEYGDNAYAGDMALIVQGDKWYVINNIPLEEYVSSVLRCESWPGWPLEVNKVFAIMVRTYAMHRIMLAKNTKKKPLFDIKSTNMHQTYKGAHEIEHLRQAVRETEHIILSYNKQPIIAMYDSCCGGVIPSKLSGYDFKTNPYLARPYACTYCTECKLYRWEVLYPKELLNSLLQKEFPELKFIKDIHISSFDAAGKVTELSVKTARAHKKIPGASMYKLCKDIKSFCYTITKDPRGYIFEGKGFGHHVGVCQWGVRTMVKKGFLCKEILDYYYPGVSLMKLVVTPEVATQEKEPDHARA